MTINVCVKKNGGFWPNTTYCTWTRGAVRVNLLQHY